MSLVGSWARALGGSAVVATTFLVGRYRDAARLAVAPLAFHPPADEVVRNPGQRELLRGQQDRLENDT